MNRMTKLKKISISLFLGFILAIAFYGIVYFLISFIAYLFTLSLLQFLLVVSIIFSIVMFSIWIYRTGDWDIVNLDD